MVVLSALICKCIQTTDIKKSTQCFCFLLSFSLLSTLHSGFCPAQKLLLSKLPGRRPSPTPRGSCQVRYDSVLTSLGLPVTSDTVGHAFLLETSSSLGLPVFPLPRLLPPSPLLDLILYTVAFPRVQLLHVFSYFPYFLGNLSPVPRPTFRSLTKTSP